MEPSVGHKGAAVLPIRAFIDKPDEAYEEYSGENQIWPHGSIIPQATLSKDAAYGRIIQFRAYQNLPALSIVDAWKRASLFCALAGTGLRPPAVKNKNDERGCGNQEVE